MKILITGGKGYIGSHLTKFLSKKHHVTTWDLGDGEDIFNELFEEIVKNVDVVIHLAALVSVADSFKYLDDYFRVNIAGTIRVGLLCQKYNKKLIYMSSAAVKDHQSSPYAMSKWVAEQVIKAYQKHHPVVILRLFNVYSTPPKLGTMMYNFLKKRTKIIRINGSGIQTRDFIHMDDLVRIIEASLSDKWNGELVEVGSGEASRVHYIASLFAKYLDKKIVSMPEVKEVKNSQANIKKLHALYLRDNKFMHNLEQDIKDMCKGGKA